MVMKENREHEMAKINIILPICAVIVMIIFGTCLMIYFRDKLPKFGNGGDFNKRSKLNMEVKNETSCDSKTKNG